MAAGSAQIVFTADARVLTRQLERLGRRLCEFNLMFVLHDAVKRLGVERVREIVHEVLP